MDDWPDGRTCERLDWIVFRLIKSKMGGGGEGRFFKGGVDLSKGISLSKGANSHVFCLQKYARKLQLEKSYPTH